MRNANADTFLAQRISRARLSKYLSESGYSLSLAPSLYERNTRLSEAFYTPFQCLEICLRNTLHDCMAQFYGAEWMFDNQVPLSHISREMIHESREALARTDRILSPDEMVAELKFAFWVGLLGPGYDATLWRSALHSAFGTRPRKVVHRRLNALRRFRNRVAHHEPIFQRDLAALHEEILEAIGWMCAHTRDWTKACSRVPSVIDGD